MLWQQGVKSGEIIEETPGRIGTTFVEVMEEGGRSLRMRGVISGYMRDEMISFFLESRLHKVDVCYTIRGRDGTSEIWVESDIHWKFPISLVTFIFGRRVKENILRQILSELAELERLCREDDERQRI